MPATAITSAQLIELADSLKGVLRDDQIERIHKVADSMTDEKKQELFDTLTELQKKHIARMKEELEVRQAMQGLYEAKVKEKKKIALQEAEVKDQQESEAEAERLLDELNSL